MRPPRISIVFFSATGATAHLAEAVRAGIADGGGDAVTLPISPERITRGRFEDAELLLACDGADALVFGTPTYMGGPSAQFKAFADATSGRWEGQRWAGKLGAGFTTGSCPNGDQGHTLAYLSIFAAQHGMLWCGLDVACGVDPVGRNRLGTQLGATAHVAGSALHADDLATARHLGRRLAWLSMRHAGNAG